MIHPAVAVGGALGLAWLLDQQRGPDPATWTAPPARDIPQVMAAVGELSLGEVCGVAILPTDRPAKQETDADVGPWFYYAAQLAALARAKGSWTVEGRRIPRLTNALLHAWGEEWYQAYRAWMAETLARKAAERADFVTWHAAWNVGRHEEAEDALIRHAEWWSSNATAAGAGDEAPTVRAGRALRARLQLLASFTHDPDDVEQLQCERMTEAVAKMAQEINNTGHILPAVDRYARGLAGFADAYRDNFVEYVATPAAGAANKVLGGAAGLAVDAAGRVLGSPIGAAVLLFIAWRVIR